MDLHGKIMNIRCSAAPETAAVFRDEGMSRIAASELAYKLGHRDARHAAAELAMKADVCIDALRAILDQQSTMGFDGSPSDELMLQARKALAAHDR